MPAGLRHVGVIRRSSLIRWRWRGAAYPTDRPAAQRLAAPTMQSPPAMHRDGRQRRDRNARPLAPGGFRVVEAHERRQDDVGRHFGASAAGCSRPKSAALERLRRVPRQKAKRRARVVTCGSASAHPAARAASASGAGSPRCPAAYSLRRSIPAATVQRTLRRHPIGAIGAKAVTNSAQVGAEGELVGHRSTRSREERGGWRDRHGRVPKYPLTPCNVRWGPCASDQDPGRDSPHG